MPMPSLQLSALQTSWLQEIGVASPFLAPYRKSVSAPAQMKSVSAPVMTSASVVPIQAKEALAQAKALLAPETTPSALPRAMQDTVLTKRVGATTDVSQIDVEQMGWEQLHAYVQQCQQCALHEQRQQVVVGAGQQQQPDWLVISSAPSSYEELAGLPMQGKSGELFAAQMQSIGIVPFEQMYMTQLLKCRSAGQSQMEYIQACFGVLLRQIELLQPKRLLLLGSKATAIFLQGDFEALRGEVHHWKSPEGVTLPTIVSYHPASILLRPQLKARAWADLLLCKRLMTT